MSILPILNQEVETYPQRKLVHFWYRGYLEPYHNIAYRSGNLKLVAQGDYQMQLSDFELYNIEIDPYERVDISATAPDVVDSLKGEFDMWYADIMQSENLKAQRIQIGSSHQNPVILNRNDTKGASAKQWMSESGMGYWDVLIVESGEYDIGVRFFNRPAIPGRTTVRFGTTQRTIDQVDVADNLVIFNSVHLKEGACMAEAWHEYKGKIYAPIYIEVFKNSEN
jgi:arylsulfatase